MTAHLLLSTSTVTTIPLRILWEGASSVVIVYIRGSHMIETLALARECTTRLPGLGSHQAQIAFAKMKAGYWRHLYEMEPMKLQQTGSLIIPRTLHQPTHNDFRVTECWKLRDPRLPHELTSTMAFVLSSKQTARLLPSDSNTLSTYL